MTVTNTASSTVPAALLNSVNPKPASSSNVDAEQDKFMTLLVTQMKNQDPLNPLDNAQVTSQFAQLSTVTGVNKLNETLQAMQASSSASDNLNAVSLINKGVLVPGNALVLADSKSVLGVEVDQKVDALQIDIRDSSGKVVQSYSQQDGVDAGIIPMPWDGTKADGSKAKDGTYSIKVTAYRDGKDVSTDVKPLSLGIVSSVSTGPNGLKINTTFGQVNLSDIKTVL